MAIVTQNQIGIYPISAGEGSCALTLVDTQFFTVSGNWDGATAVAAGATSVHILMSGGAGGGGTGELDEVGSTRDGGKGGGPGSLIFITGIPVSELSLTESFVSGVGGLGAPGNSTNSSTGAAGLNGSPSTFSLYKALGGEGGPTSSGSGTADIPPITIGSFINAFTSFSETVVSVGATFNLFSSQIGGNGGRISNGNNADPGQNSTMDVSFSSQAAITALGGISSAGEDGKVYSSYFSTGAAGGGPNDAGTISGAGGNGKQGAGGGGGAAATDGNVAGAGGIGGNGILVVFAYK